MLESIFIDSGSTELTLTMGSMLTSCIVSLILGLAIAVCYMICSEKYSRNFVITLVVLPILVQMVIIMVNGNLGTGVAIVGAFSLVRFRSIPGTSRDIGTIFFAMAAGLATGMGYIGYAAIFTLIVAAVFILLTKTGFGLKKESESQLKVVIPENLNYTGLFDDIFEKYTTRHKLERVKTTNLGSMFELNYNFELKGNADEKSMLDEIRTRNGNLTVTCGKLTKEVEEL